MRLSSLLSAFASRRRSVATRRSGCVSCKIIETYTLLSSNRIQKSVGSVAGSPG